jgi:hypothetical protein
MDFIVNLNNAYIKTISNFYTNNNIAYYASKLNEEINSSNSNQCTSNIKDSILIRYFTKDTFEFTINYGVFNHPLI